MRVGLVQPWIDAGSGRINPLRLGASHNTLMPVAGLSAAMHDGVDDNPLELQLLAVVDNKGKACENITPNFRLFDDTPTSWGDNQSRNLTPRR